MVDAVINTPDQIIDAHSGRKVYQSQHKTNDKLYLIRVIVEESNPLLIITVQATSKNTGEMNHESNL